MGDTNGEKFSKRFERGTWKITFWQASLKMQVCSKKFEFSNELDLAGAPTICPVAGIPFPLENLQPFHKARRHFLKFFLDVSFYHCVIPYKIIQSEDGTYKKKSFFLQQILCLVVHITATLDLATYLRSIPFGQVTGNPRMYFDIFILIVHTTLIVTFCYSMWRNSSQFCWLVRTVQMCPIVSLWYPKKINLIVSLITVIYVVMSLLNPLFNEGEGHSWESLFYTHASRGRYMLFLSGESVSLKRHHQQNYTANGVFAPNENNNHSYRSLDIMFALFSYFANTSQYLVVYHADLMVNVVSLTLWCATSFFVNTLKQQACMQALVNYEALKKLSGHINAVAGTIVLTYTVDSILYYATNLESLFTGKNWFSKLMVFQFLLSSVSWLHFASCACLQMEKFRDWVRQKDNRSLLPSKSISIMLLLDEISTNVVGVSGNGLFTINYKFVAQAITTVMTYFILVIQFNK